MVICDFSGLSVFLKVLKRNTKNPPKSIPEIPQNYKEILGHLQILM